MSERAQTGIALVLLTGILFAGAVVLQVLGLDYGWAQGAFLVTVGATVRHIIGGALTGGDK